MTSTSIDQFQLHSRSSIRDAGGATIFSVSALPLHGGCAAEDSQSVLLSARDEISAEIETHPPRIHFISDKTPLLALIAVLQEALGGRSFCVVPAAMHQVRRFASSFNEQPEESRPEPEQCVLPEFQCMSSGTSGTARRIKRSQRSWINSFKVNASLMQISTGDSYAVIGKLSHSLPLYAALEACYLGADVHLLSQLRPDRQLDAMATLGSTVLYVTPTQARQLCAVHGSVNRPGLRIRLLLCGGGKLDDKTRARLKCLFDGAVVVEFYGASETSFITMSTEQTPTGSVGRAYPGVSIKIIGENGENGEHGENDEHSEHSEHSERATGVGEIWVKSEYLFMGYASGGWRDTQIKDGYLSIGETGRMDETGHLFLSGRKSRQANVADNFVYLQEIEDTLLQHAEVHHCVVIATQEPLRGEVLVAVIEGRADTLLRADILRHARQQLGPTLAPRDILFLDAMPQLSAGKPDIRLIQTMVDSR